MSLQGNIAVEVEMRALLKYIEEQEREGVRPTAILLNVKKRIQTTVKSAQSGWL